MRPQNYETLKPSTQGLFTFVKFLYQWFTAVNLMVKLAKSDGTCLHYDAHERAADAELKIKTDWIQPQRYKFIEAT